MRTTIQLTAFGPREYYQDGTPVGPKPRLDLSYETVWCGSSMDFARHGQTKGALLDPREQSEDEKLAALQMWYSDVESTTHEIELARARAQLAAAPKAA